MRTVAEKMGTYLEEGPQIVEQFGRSIQSGVSMDSINSKLLQSYNI